MKHQTRRTHRAVIVALAVVALFNSAIAPISARAISIESAPPTSRLLTPTLPETNEQTKESARQSMAKLPLSFEINQGQVSSLVRFLARGNGYNIFLTPAEAVLSLRSSDTAKDPENWIRSRRSGKKEARESAALQIRLAGANKDANIVGVDQLPGKSNYLIGDDRSKWYTGISTFAKVKLEQIYPGMDAIYYGNQRELEYDFIGTHLRRSLSS